MSFPCDQFEGGDSVAHLRQDSGGLRDEHRGLDTVRSCSTPSFHSRTSGDKRTVSSIPLNESAGNVHLEIESGTERFLERFEGDWRLDSIEISELGKVDDRDLFDSFARELLREAVRDSRLCGKTSASCSSKSRREDTHE